MKRPSFQFYPSDWLGNSNLRRCSHAEKGVWIDVMCLMHDSEEYGILRWSLKEIAQAVGCKMADLKSLIAKGVLKGSDTELDEELTYTPVSGRKKGPTVILIAITKGPLWYSSRMVIDEYKRNARGGNDDAPNHSPKPTIGESIDDTPNHTPSRARPRAAGRPSSSTSTTQEPNGSFVSVAHEAQNTTRTTAPADMQPERTHVAIAGNLNLDVHAELAKFLDHHRAEGSTYADWNAAFSKWLRTARQFGSGKDQQRQPQQSRQDAIANACDTLGVGSQYLTQEPHHALR